MERIKVIIRARPLTELEIASQEQEISYQIPSNSQTSLELTKTTSNKLSSFLETLKNFTLFYPPHAKTLEIHQEIVTQLLFSWFSGINVSIFMYGQTGTGKTYTMLGDPFSKGLIFLSIEDIMSHCQVLSGLRCSYLEIYNDNIFDLLAEKEQVCEQLVLNEDVATREFYIKGLIEKEIGSLEHVKQVIKQGESNRHYAETSLNHTSSRSHTIFRISYDFKGEACFLVIFLVFKWFFFGFFCLFFFF